MTGCQRGPGAVWLDGLWQQLERKGLSTRSWGLAVAIGSRPHVCECRPGADQMWVGHGAPASLDPVSPLPRQGSLAQAPL